MHLIIFFMLIDMKSFEYFPKCKGYYFILELFALNSHIFLALTNKKTVASIIMQTLTELSIWS